ncbi:hypothetical protein LARV_02200 [Longilinea arvoryzae]|uniref:DUF4230 domain-containing protein n=1 Tax=Longilinea arvoryzae TaxID=360412 RepID=A0A0S7BA40_9CHLR|nr:DUF4230 domain-containing protein [Longilinea arvoryzae]GAP14431.1 hypothetical protein LARV_02200 [Longilinea arvoryzae]
MNPEPQRNNRAIVIVLGVLGLILVVYLFLILFFVKETTDRILAPLENSNRNLSTQVAELLHPTPTIYPDPVTIIHEVRSLARLETIQYTVEKVITAETGQKLGILFGDRLLFVAYGRVIAGVDLTKLETSDLYMQNGALHVRLPSPEIFVATLDNDKSYVYDREQGLLTHGDEDLETRARQVAESEVLQSAVADGILDQALQNAKNYLERLLRNLGYQEIIFESTPISTPTPLPPAQ